MATVHPLPAPAVANRVESQPGTVPATGVAQAAAAQSLIPAPHPPQDEAGIAFSGPVTRLPVELDVVVPVREFRMRHLLALVPGQVIESQWAHGDDLPLAASDVQLAWSEFEVVETRLAVRLTRLA